MTDNIAVLIKDRNRQYEGLRTSLGLLLEMAEVKMFVLNHEIENMDEAYSENMEFIDEMEGERYSNNRDNVEKYGFEFATLPEISQMLKQARLVIPF
ncbi:hypothetical protein SAMN02746065_10611 [Desulfocicer vacuolatum DSM 3385]|uniref:DsrE/DsrF-like family protein n=1 Tax=Desulfocicer vacuolatum DSM 3385 TaxID=1121400 RepID=A0A1W2AQ89_9BACT|nr:hypothetical protein [Desulfocicer vacuolatum]SMC62845.1 hypothetical protein SAMN02746065_10611 [Desulfocicer vacuolatum DSM 3385]